MNREQEINYAGVPCSHGVIVRIQDGYSIEYCKYCHEILNLDGILTKEREEAEKEMFEEAEEYREKTRAVLEAIKNKEVIYISTHDAHIITEEQYFDFEDYVDTVGMPSGSSVERFMKVDLSQTKGDKE